MRRTQVVITSCLVPFASALSLANFQQISPGAVSVLCLVTYDSQIPSCTIADFEDGAACSAACISGLEQINQAVDEACSGIEVSSATLLGMVFQNKMIGALCPNSVTTTTAAASIQSTTIAPPPPSTSTTTSVLKSSIISSTSTTPIIVKTTSTTATTKSTSSTSAKQTTSSTSSISTTSISTTSTSKSSLAFETTAISTSSTSTKSAVAQQSDTSEQQQQIEASKDTGGGSPFDIVDSSGPLRISRGGHLSILAVSALMIGMFITL